MGEKHLMEVSLELCRHSRFNTRKTRSAGETKKLAERIAKFGFERTRAPWAVKNGETFEIFAGGTRLESAKQAGLGSIPILLHTGFTDEEISQLSDIDNENDEYHIPVSPVDIWAEYARLKQEEGWKQEKIAAVKNVAQSTVSRRLRLDDSPTQIKSFMRQGLISEWHLFEIIEICVVEYFAPWLTSQQAWQELAELAVSGVRKDGKKSVRAVAKDVKSWKAFIVEAEREYQNLKPITLYRFKSNEPEPFVFDAPSEFVKELARREARTVSAVKAAAREIRLFIKDNLATYETFIREKSTEAAKAARKSEKEKEILNKFLLGDCLELVDRLETKSVRLLLLDPPYGQEYQSNRRWRSEAPPKLSGDEPGEALKLFKSVLKTYRSALMDDAHLLIFSSWRNEPLFRKILEEEGFSIKGSLVWAKEEHSAGDLEGAFAPSYEHIIHAVQGHPLVEPRIRDVLTYNRDLKAPHPTAKPVLLLEKLIRSCTSEGELVIDPMAGWASTLLAAWNCDRDFWGCEINAQFHDDGCARLLEKLEEEFCEEKS